MFSAVAKPFLSPSTPLFRLPLSSISISFRVFPSFFSSSSSSQLPSPQSSNPITPLIFSNRNYSRHAFIVDQYLSCSMPEKPLRVAVLLSGGVDSSVALRLLHAAGHSCTAFYLKIWFQVCFFFFFFVIACWNHRHGFVMFRCSVGRLWEFLESVPLGRWFEVCKTCLWAGSVLNKPFRFLFQKVHALYTFTMKGRCLLFLVVPFLQVDVPLEVVHLTDEYWERVVSSFFVASF